uniref:Uncharacterized protein n=1 Tax=Panagrolaimus davidi TaxID=227884 RepID=A0A914Q3C7_9BILA
MKFSVVLFISIIIGVLTHAPYSNSSTNCPNGFVMTIPALLIGVAGAIVICHVILDTTFIFYGNQYDTEIALSRIYVSITTVWFIGCSLAYNSRIEGQRFLLFFCGFLLYLFFNAVIQFNVFNEREFKENHCKSDSKAVFDIVANVFSLGATVGAVFLNWFKTNKNCSYYTLHELIESFESGRLSNLSVGVDHTWIIKFP